MNRSSMSLTALSLLGLTALLTLQAREDAAPDDLARVPATSQLMVTVRVSDVWKSELGKDLRKLFAKPLEKVMQELKEVKIEVEDIDRATIVMGELGPRAEPVVLLRASKKVDAKALIAKMAPDAKTKEIGGETVYGSRNVGLFVTSDGKTMGIGPIDGLTAVLENKRKATGTLGMALSKAGKHDIVAYVDPTAAIKMVGDLPPALAPAKPLLLTKDGVAWMDVGYTSKMGMRLNFPEDKAAGKGRKAIDAGRALASLSLSGAGDQIAGKSKPIADLISAVVKMLDDGTVEQKDTAVDVAMELKLDKDSALAAGKEMLDKVTIASTRMVSQNNLKQMGLGMHNYHDTMGVFPQAIRDKDGKALLSWRVAMLPYIEQDVLYKEFKLNEPWDSAHNKKLIAKMPTIYVVPGSKAVNPGGTFYQVFYGKGAGFEGTKGTRIADITDGTSNTIMIVEAAKDVTWTKPDDLAFDPDGKLPALGGHFEGGYNAAFFDGSVRFITSKIDPKILKIIITRNGGEVVPGF